MAPKEIKDYFRLGGFLLAMIGILAGVQGAKDIRQDHEIDVVETDLKAHEAWGRECHNDLVQRMARQEIHAMYIRETLDRIDSKLSYTGEVAQPPETDSVVSQPVRRVGERR